MTITANVETKARRAVWNTDDHPRDRRGRWIETGAEVRVWGGGRGTVVRNVGGGRLEVRLADGSLQRVHRNYLTVERSPGGKAPTGRADARPAPQKVERPSRAATDYTPDGKDTRTPVQELRERDAALVYGQDADGNDVARIGFVVSHGPGEDGEYVVRLESANGTEDIHTSPDDRARVLPTEDLQQLVDAINRGDADERARNLLDNALRFDDNESEQTTRPPAAENLNWVDGDEIAAAIAPFDDNAADRLRGLFADMSATQNREDAERAWGDIDAALEDLEESQAAAGSEDVATAIATLRLRLDNRLASSGLTKPARDDARQDDGDTSAGDTASGEASAGPRKGDRVRLANGAEGTVADTGDDGALVVELDGSGSRVNTNASAVTRLEPAPDNDGSGDGAEREQPEPQPNPEPERDAGDSTPAGATWPDGGLADVDAARAYLRGRPADAMPVRKVDGQGLIRSDSATPAFRPDTDESYTARVEDTYRGLAAMADDPDLWVTPGGKLVVYRGDPDPEVDDWRVNIARIGRGLPPFTADLDKEEARSLATAWEAGMVAGDGTTPWELVSARDILDWRSNEGYTFTTQLSILTARWRRQHGLDPDPTGATEWSAAKEDLRRAGLHDQTGRPADDPYNRELPTVEDLAARYRALRTGGLHNLATNLASRSRNRRWESDGNRDTWKPHQDAVRQVLSEHEQAAERSRQASAKYKAGDVDGALADLDEAARLAPNARDWAAIRAKVAAGRAGSETSGDGEKPNPKPKPVRRPPRKPKPQPRPAPGPLREGAFASLDEARVHLRQMAADPETAAERRGFLEKFAEDPSLKLTGEGGLLLAKTNQREWYITHARSGLLLPGADSEWGGAKPAAELAARYEAIVGADGEQINWADPDLPKWLPSWRSDRGENIAAAILRVKGEWDATNGKDTLAAREHMKRAIDPNRGEAPEGKAYADQIQAGMTVYFSDARSSGLVSKVEDQGDGGFLLHFENRPPFRADRNELLELAPDARVYDAAGNRRGVTTLASFLRTGDWVEYVETDPNVLREYGLTDRPFGVLIRGSAAGDGDPPRRPDLRQVTVHDRGTGREIALTRSPSGPVTLPRKVVRLDGPPDNAPIGPVLDEDTDARGFIRGSTEQVTRGDEIEAQATTASASSADRYGSVVNSYNLLADDGQPVPDGTPIIVRGMVAANEGYVIHKRGDDLRLASATWHTPDGSRSGTFRSDGYGGGGVLLTVRGPVYRRSTAATDRPEEEQISTAGRADRAAGVFRLNPVAAGEAAKHDPDPGRVASLGAELDGADPADLDRFATTAWLALRDLQPGEGRDLAARLVVLDLEARRRGYLGPSREYLDGRDRVIRLQGEEYADNIVQGLSDEQLRGVTDGLLAMRDRDGEDPPMLARALSETQRRRTQRPVQDMSRDDIQAALADVDPGFGEQTGRLRALLDNPDSRTEDVEAAWAELDDAVTARIAQLDADGDSGAGEWLQSAHYELGDWMREADHRPTTSEQRERRANLPNLSDAELIKLSQGTSTWRDPDLAEDLVAELARRGYDSEGDPLPGSRTGFVNPVQPSEDLEGRLVVHNDTTGRLLVGKLTRDGDTWKITHRERDRETSTPLVGERWVDAPSPGDERLADLEPGDYSTPELDGEINRLGEQLRVRWDAGERPGSGEFDELQARHRRLAAEWEQRPDRDQTRDEPTDLGEGLFDDAGNVNPAAEADKPALDPATNGGYVRAWQVQVGDSVFPGGRERDSAPELVDAITDNDDGTRTLHLHTGQTLTVTRNHAVVRGGDLIARDGAGERYGVTTQAAGLREGDWVELTTSDREQLLQVRQNGRVAEGVIVRGRVAATPTEGGGRVRLEQVTVHDTRTGDQIGTAGGFELGQRSRPVRLDTLPTDGPAHGRTGQPVPDGGRWGVPGEASIGSQVAIPLRGDHPALAKLGLGPADRVTVHGRVRDHNAVNQGWGGHDLLLDGGRWESVDGRSGDLPAGWLRLPADAGLYHAAGTPDPSWERPAVDEIAVGDRLPEGDVEQVTRAGEFVFLTVRDGDDRRTTIATRTGESVNRLAAGGGQAPAPVTITPVPSTTLKSGDRVLMQERGGPHAPATVTNITDESDGRWVTVRYDDGRTDLFRARDDREMRRLDGPDSRVEDDTTGDDGQPPEPPRPDPLPRDVPAARPVLYTYQRQNLVALGLDTSEDDTVREAALRLRHRMPLSADQADALANAVRAAADDPAVKPARRRALQRAAHRLAAAGAEARGLPAPEPPENRAAPERTRAANLTPGDTIAVPGPDGQPQLVTVRTARTMMRGRLVEVEIEHDDGSRETRVITGRTDLWLLPDLPDDKPDPGPGGREHIHPSQLRAGDRIQLDGDDLEVVSAEYDWYNRTGRAQVRDADGNTWGEEFYDWEARPSVIRSGRGPASADQAWDGLLPDEDPAEIGPDEVRVGDLVRTDSIGGYPVTGNVEAITPIVGDDGAVTGQALWLRELNGQITATSVNTGGTLTRLSDADTTYARHILAAQQRQERDKRARTISDQFMQSARDAYKEYSQDVGGISVGDTLESIIDRIEAAHRKRIANPALQDLVRAGRITNALEVSDQAQGQAKERLLQVFADLHTAAKDRIIESLRQATPTGAETERRAWRRVLDQHYTDPPTDRNLFRTASTTLAELRDSLGGRGRDDSNGGGELSVPGVEETGTDLAARMDAYRTALGGGEAFGKRRLQRSIFKPTTFADLEAGRVPDIEQVDAFVRDEAADGGPGEHAMAHLALVRAAGRELDDRFQARRAAILGPLDQEEKDLKRELAELEEKIREHKRTFDAAVKEEMKAILRAHGFSSLTALKRAITQARKNGNEAEALRLRRLVQRIDGDANDAARTRIGWYSDGGRTHRVRARLALIRKDLGQADRDAAIELLREIRPDGVGGVRIGWKNPATGQPYTDRSSLLQAMRFAEDAYPTQWLEAFRDRGGRQGWSLEKVARGHYNDYYRRIALSEQSERTRDGGTLGNVAVHEMGHGMERAVPGLWEAQWALLWSRTSTGEIGSRQREQLTEIYKGTKETGYKDDFPEHYTGKEYNDGKHFEVFTTTVESLLGGSSYLDDDLRHWLLGVMAIL
ncbi:hypothetical protein ACIHFD_49455 [Nonomuraea sp. NPDC051941]|uniref:hypothetical protein n=1 Tax=Nonomuraea sp. NPDC051941 TaxID=3364373 RepID=UPI0037C5F7AE